MLVPLEPRAFGVAADLLTEGFPTRSRAFWEQGLERLARGGGNAAAGHPLGFFWQEGGEPAGIALTPASLRRATDRPEERHINISSWYLRPEARWRAPLMLRGLFARKDTIFTDLTPTPEVARMLPAFGFQPVNQGLLLRPLPWLALGSGGGARIAPLPAGETVAASGIDAALLDGHRAFGCLPYRLRDSEGEMLVVVRRSRARGLPALRLVHAASHTRLERAIGAVARALLATRSALLITEARRSEEARGPWFRPRGIWFAKNHTFEDRTDHVGSEMCLLDL